GEPRIVFVASGGVFRGAFHVGMLGALTEAAVVPDLVVGASVGALLGAVLAAMARMDKGEAIGVLRRLVHLFERVDEKVALTLTVKPAARDLGIRGRAIDLSPNDVRRMVSEGGRSDPGYAATGAPPALIDALRDFFMIPYAATSSIAAD